MAYDPIHAVRGEPVRLDITFTRDDGAGPVDWNDLADFNPEAELRWEPDSLRVAATWDLSVAGNVLSMVLVTTDLKAGTYETDVDFYDPDEDDRDLARFTWPGPGEERLKVIVGADVSRVEEP